MTLPARQAAGSGAKFQRPPFGRFPTTTYRSGICCCATAFLCGAALSATAHAQFTSEQDTPSPVGELYDASEEVEFNPLLSLSAKL